MKPLNMESADVAINSRYLKDHGANEQPEPWFCNHATGFIAVCLINHHGLRESAAVAYSVEEFERLLPHPDDQRPRRWFSVPIALVRQHAPDLDARLGAP